MLHFTGERAGFTAGETSSTFGSEICVPGRKSLKSRSGLYCCSSQTGTFTLRCVMLQSESPRRAI